MYKESVLRAKTKLTECGKLAARHWPLSTSVLLLTITVILLVENGHSEINKDKHDNVSTMVCGEYMLASPCIYKTSSITFYLKVLKYVDVPVVLVISYSCFI